MKRAAITLEDIASRENLLLAVYKAARGKRDRGEVQRWLQNLETELARLACSILRETAPSGAMRCFTIHDPKRRVISAASFADRVLHHAILNLAEAHFERALVPSCYACRPGKGVHAAVQAVQQNLRRFRWWVRVDVESYFANIEHARLNQLLARKFKDRGMQALLARIVAASPESAESGRGLPIGALTSQHFANLFLDAADRCLLAHRSVRAHVRYMDDIVWWCDTQAESSAVLIELQRFLLEQRGLVLKQNVGLGRSTQGLLYCGFRVRQGVILPSSRKMQRFRSGLQLLQRSLVPASAQSTIPSPAELQRACDVQAARLAGCQSRHFRHRVCADLGAYHWEL